MHANTTFGLSGYPNRYTMMKSALVAKRRCVGLRVVMRFTGDVTEHTRRLVLNL